MASCRCATGLAGSGVSGQGSGSGAKDLQQQQRVVDYRERMDGWMTLRVLSVVDLDSCYASNQD